MSGTQGVFDAAVTLNAAGTDPAAREAALISILNQANRTVMAQQDRMLALEAQVTQLVTQAAQRPVGEPASYAHRGGRGPKERTPLSRIRGADKLATFGGKREEFQTWATKFTTFMSDEPGLRNILKRVSTVMAPLSDEYMRELQNDFDPEEVDVEWYSSQLHNIMMMITTGTPFTIVENTDGHGLEAWRKLYILYAAVTPQSKRQVMHLLMNFKKAKDYEDVMSVQAEWGAVHRRYVEMTREKVNDDVLVASYINILPDTIAESLKNLNEDLSTLEEVTEYVARLVNTHRKPTTFKEHKPVPMDLGALDAVREALYTHTHCNLEQTEEQQENHGEAGTQSNVDNQTEMAHLLASLIKGYGKGKGDKGGGKGGKGPIICNHCGRAGHIKSQCRDLDKLMQEYRESKGKGKGQDGWQQTGWQQKGGWGQEKGGWSQPGGYWQNTWQQPPAKGKGWGKSDTWGKGASWGKGSKGQP